MISKLITLLTFIFGPAADEPKFGSYDVPPATSGKGAKAVIPKETTPNPLDYPPGIDPPWYPPVPTPPKITEL
jgi:hypothetical protein